MNPKMIDRKITEKELAMILDIREETVIKLVVTKQLPFVKLKNKVFFEFDKVIEHLESLEQSIAC